MEVSFDVEKKNLVDFSLYNVKNSKEIQKMVKIQQFLTPLVLLVFAVIAGYIQQDMRKWISIFVIVYAIWIAVYPIWYMAAVKKNIKREIDQVNGDKDRIGHCKLTLTEQEVIEESNARTHKSKWRELVRFVQTKEYVFIFNTDNSAYVIPKSSFEDKDHEEKYVKMLANKSHKEIEQWN